MDEHLAAAVVSAWWRRRRRPAWRDLLDCADPRTGVRAPARVWRAVLLELGVRRFEEMPADRAALQALVDRVREGLPPRRRRGRAAHGG